MIYIDNVVEQVLRSCADMLAEAARQLRLANATDHSTLCDAHASIARLLLEARSAGHQAIAMAMPTADSQGILPAHKIRLVHIKEAAQAISDRIVGKLAGDRIPMAQAQIGDTSFLGNSGASALPMPLDACTQHWVQCAAEEGDAAAREILGQQVASPMNYSTQVATRLDGVSQGLHPASASS